MENRYVEDALLAVCWKIKTCEIRTVNVVIWNELLIVSGAND